MEPASLCSWCCTGSVLCIHFCWCSVSLLREICWMLAVRKTVEWCTPERQQKSSEAHLCNPGCLPGSVTHRCKLQAGPGQKPVLPCPQGWCCCALRQVNVIFCWLLTELRSLPDLLVERARSLCLLVLSPCSSSVLTEVSPFPGHPRKCAVLLAEGLGGRCGCAHLRSTC